MKKAQSVPLRRGCEVEVCSEEVGFEGAWFKAILEDVPSKSGKKKLNVRFLDLEADDGSPLLDKTYRRFIRPVPPENLFSSTDDFEEGSVVEAAHRDGWWTGVFVKKIDEDKHLVYFNSPPDLIHFKRRQLRHHYEWTKAGEWVRPQNKQLSKNCGTVVEVMENTKDVVWVPAIVVKEMEDGRNTIVKSCKYLSWNDEIKPTRTVSSSNIRPTPTALSVENYELTEPVDVFIDPGWRPGIVMKILCENEYTVCLQATNELLVFKHSDLRPSNESVSERFMRNSNVVTAATTPQMSLNHAENGEATAIPEGEAVAATESCLVFGTREQSLAQGSGNGMVDHVQNETALTKQTEYRAQGKMSCEKTLEPMRNPNGLGSETTGEKMHEEHNCDDDSPQRRRREVEHNSNLNETGNESVSPVTLSPAMTVTTLKQIAILTKSFSKKTVQPVRNQNGLGNDSAQENEISEDNNRKRKREQNLSSYAGVEEAQAKDTTMVLPFAKKSPLWKTCETMEVFQRVPQSPHFSPLAEAKEDFREGFALGMMLTFSGLLETSNDLKVDVPMSQLESLKDSFTELERHGFNVTTHLARIDKLLAVKVRQVNIMEKLNGLEREMTAESRKKLEAEEEFGEIECKILELQRQQVALKEKKEAACRNICHVESCARDLGLKLEDVESEFERIVSAPW